MRGQGFIVLAVDVILDEIAPRTTEGSSGRARGRPRTQLVTSPYEQKLKMGWGYPRGLSLNFSLKNLPCKFCASDTKVGTFVLFRVRGGEPLNQAEEMRLDVFYLMFQVVISPPGWGAEDFTIPANITIGTIPLTQATVEKYIHQLKVRVYLVTCNHGEERSNRQFVKLSFCIVLAGRSFGGSGKHEFARREIRGQEAKEACQEITGKRASEAGAHDP